MRSIFRTGEVGVIRPDHRIWAIILTPPFEPIDLKKMERRYLSHLLPVSVLPTTSQKCDRKKGKIPF